MKSPFSWSQAPEIQISQFCHLNPLVSVKILHFSTKYAVHFKPLFFQYRLTPLFIFLAYQINIKNKCLQACSDLLHIKTNNSSKKSS